MKPALVLLAFIAMLVFALCGAFAVDLGGVNNLYAALSSLAAGLVLKYLPE